MPPTNSIRRVVFTSPGWPPAAAQNGIATYIEYLRGGLESAGVSSRVVISGTQPEPVAEFVFEVESYASDGAFDRIRRGLIRRFAPDQASQMESRERLVAALRRIDRVWPHDLVEMEESFGVAEALRTQLRAPTVVRLHGPWFLNREALGIEHNETAAHREREERRAILRAVGVSSPSANVLDHVRRQYGAELPHAEVIPNPAPEVDERSRWRLDACDRNLVLFIGRFDRHKGGDVMIDAFRRVAAEVPSAELAFVGPDRGLVEPGGRRTSLREYVEARLDEGTRARLRITGPLGRERIDDLRRRALVTVVPSRYENFAMTVLEAIAVGSPLVTSGAGGIAEIVRDGETARFFENASPESLAAVLVDLLRHPEAAAALGDRAFHHCRARFAPRVVAREMVGFYERVLARHAALGRVGAAR